MDHVLAVNAAAVCNEVYKEEVLQSVPFHLSPVPSGHLEFMSGRRFGAAVSPITL